MFVSELKSNYVSLGLPEKFVNTLPDVCDECGAPLEIGEALTGLHCSNPKCKGKIVMRIKAICQDLGILNFGEKTIEKFVEYYDVQSPLEVFVLQPGMILSDEVSDKISDDVITQFDEHKEFLLWELVMVANLPGVRTSARKIFQGYTNFTEAFRDISGGGIEFIQEKLGIENNGEVSVKAVQVYNTLMENMEDLLEVEKYVTIKDMTNIRELNVVCSDQVGGGFSKKAEFYNHINTVYADRVHVNFLSSVNKNIDYLVWAGADGSPARYTNKVKTVERYNDKGCDIPIVTAEQFIQDVEGMCE